MDFYIKTHIVEKGETLELIAGMYNIPEVEMLRDFHNNNVPNVKNCIGWTVAAGEELFIPQQKDILKVLDTRKSRINEQFEKQQNRLLKRYFDFPFYKGRHQYLITVNDKNDSSSFLLEIEHVMENEEKFHLKINQKRGNNEEPDSSVEKMADDINENLFPIELIINKLGIIEKINNSHDLKANWKSKKEDLYEFFEGNIGKIFLDKIESSLSDIEKLKKMLNENLLWKLLLNSYLGGYADGINQKKINLLNYNFDLMNRVVKGEKEDQTYTISQEITRPDHTEEIVAEADYHIDIKTHILQSAEIKLKDWFENLNIVITQIT
ncbi:hypothetical protein SAMN05421664_0856 [Chryseobacterium soldanellicola]|uniref:LysM domain-containing protein n=1 Tax=Chryseobacterium soldanellicola TaxID=311333 RepID=A0A1H0YP49_9FLAO|nr:LysM peptidoglycan-binding domain-containing protein [Chryseobacterium soldanellicola]SDQ16964.1 hypothetical protein SAMN05421664_0856 [Chryseobacterium soldanellicola]